MKDQNNKNTYQYNYVCSTTSSATFNHQFQNVHQIQFSTLQTGKATALWKKFQKMKHNLSKISALFCHLFILCLMILIWILTILISTILISFTKVFLFTSQILVVIVASQETNIANMSDDRSIIVNTRSGNSVETKTK